MSKGRFALLVTLLAMGVAAACFVIGLRVLDDGKPDPAPSVAAAAATDTTLPPVAASSTTTSPNAPVTTPPGALETPAWVTIVASEGSREMAEEEAARVAANGHPSGVLHSDDYPSLKPGLWVAYAGPYPDARAAEAAIEALAADGISGAYVRCAGSKKECSGDDDDDSD